MLPDTVWLFALDRAGEAGEIGSQHAAHHAGGVFTQEITHDERVLTTMLYQRKLCTHSTPCQRAGRQHYEAIAKALRPVYTAPSTPPRPSPRRLSGS